MVFTETVWISGTGLDRRRLLGAAAGIGLSTAALAGCGLFDQDETGKDRTGKDRQPATPDALQPVLDEAVALAATYDRAAVAQPGLGARLTPLAADHRAHAAELAQVIGKAAPSAPAPSAPAPSAPGSGAPAPSAPGSGASAGRAAVLADLRAAEQAAQKTAVTACKQAPVTRAALAGSIAACRASHAETLR